MSLRSDRITKQVLAMYAADPSLKQKQVAEAVGVSVRTVQRIMDYNWPTIETIDGKLKDIRERIKERLPIKDRVEILASVAQSSELDFARLNAVKYINELDDIHPELERKKAQRDAEQPKNIEIRIVHIGGELNVSTPALEVIPVG